MSDPEPEQPPDPELPEPDRPDLAPAAELPAFRHYEVRERIGEGSTAIVYRAWDRELKRLVALKVFRPGILSSDLTFPVEGSAASGLVHPNVVTLHKASLEEGRPYLSVDLITGRSLRTILQDESRPQRELLTLLAGAARGVAAAHERGLVHRDLKPANILVSTSGEAKVTDFALLQLLDIDAVLERCDAPPGTPAYLAPEQVDDHAQMLTPATDVFALGAMLYEILTGVAPHVGTTLQETCDSIRSEEPVPPRQAAPGIPPDLETIALHALEKKPAGRYPTAGAFADALDRYLSGKPIEAAGSAPPKRGRRRQHPLVLLALCLALLGIAGGIAVGIHYVRSRPPSSAPK
jgi:serine/threonine-protein kinase